MAPTVLVVDDDRHFVAALRHRLRLGGFQTLGASSGGAAIRAYDEALPDVVLLDASLPDISGFDVCQHVRLHQPERHARIIIVSGASAPSPDYISDCARICDADAYVRKPFPFERLREMVTEMVSRPVPTEVEA